MLAARQGEIGHRGEFVVDGELHEHDDLWAAPGPVLVLETRRGTLPYRQAERALSLMPGSREELARRYLGELREWRPVVVLAVGLLFAPLSASALLGMVF